MSLQIVAVKEDVGFNRPQLRNVSFNTSNQYTSWTSKPDSSCTLRDVVPSRFTAPFTPADRRYKIWISWSRCLCEEVSAIASRSTVAALVDHIFEVQLLTLQIRRRSNTMHQSKGHSSSLVLTIRKCELWNSTLVYWLIIDSEPLGAPQSSTQSHGLHTIPSPVASNNAACPRWK
ncbi:unnamed protein product, partial [Penicillium nalgiovense]